jgi:hypothetical protein
MGQQVSRMLKLREVGITRSSNQVNSSNATVAPVAVAESNNIQQQIGTSYKKVFAPGSGGLVQPSHRYITSLIPSALDQTRKIEEVWTCLMKVGSLVHALQSERGYR